MELPARLKALVRQAMEQGEKNVPAALSRRKGAGREDHLFTDRYQVLTGPQADELLKAWQDFHAGLPYQRFSEFYSKRGLIQSLCFHHLSEEALLDLIADRSFLFLEDNQHLNAPDCPSLSDLCRSPGRCEQADIPAEFERCLEACVPEQLRDVDPAPSRAEEIIRAAFCFVYDAPSLPITAETLTGAIWERMDYEALEDASYSRVLKSVQAVFSKLFARCKVTRNAQLVLSQGLIPTMAHWDSYRQWLDHRTELRNALERRRGYIRRYQENQALPLQLRIDSFSIPIRREDRPAEDLEKKLSILFHAYLRQAAEYAYQSDYAPYCQDAPLSWAGECGCVLRGLKETQPRADYPLVFYRLFTGETLKLARHAIRRYTFRPPKTAPKGLRPPEAVSPVIYRRILCNIQLYDHLLQLFPPDDPGYAKFCFYVFTQYQWYTHFQLPPAAAGAGQGAEAYHPRFDLPADSRDGVDELGHLLRHHIFFCLFNKVDWLTPSLPNTIRDDAVTLAQLLLYDAAIPFSPSRLTNRIHESLSSGDGKKLLEQYQSLQHQPDQKIVDVLTAYCKEHGLLFHGEDRIYESGKPTSRESLLYSRYTLEFELKELLARQQRNALAQLAQKHFGALFCTDDPFGLD